MNVENVAAGEDAGDRRFEPLVDQRAVRHGADGRTEAARQLILGDQAAGEQERITVVMALGSRDGTAVRADLGDGHAGDALAALDVDDRVAEVERNAEIVEALDDVPLEAAGIRHQLRDGEDLCALERHAAGHDEADVAAAEDDDAAADHAALDVDKALRRPGGVDACGAEAGDVQCAAWPFAAAHGEDDALRLDREAAVGGIERGHGLVRRDAEHHRVQQERDVPLRGLIDESLGIFRAGQLLLEGVESEAVVDALVEDAAELRIALQNQDVLAVRVVRGDRRSKARRAAADDEHVDLFHFVPSFG